MKYKIRWSDHVLDLGKKTRVMGILNVTPDSFSDGGRFIQINKAVDHAFQMVEDGADIIDIGGESTRPFADKLSTDEELDRVLPVIEIISKELSIPISIDTYKSKVASESLKVGANLINDISAAGFDPQMATVAAQAKVPMILMHMKGTPQSMQKEPTYENVVSEIILFLQKAIAYCKEQGVLEERIIVDPGIGFGKTFDHNLAIIKNLSHFKCLKRPLLLGTSNKAFIGHILDQASPDERDTGTMATVSACVMNGAHIVRVHHVKKAVHTIKIIDAVKRGSVI